VSSGTEPELPRSGADAEIERKARPFFIALHGATGFVFGLLAGLWIWARTSRTFHDSDLAFLLIVGGVTLLFTVLAASLRERFWESWKSPFWWL